MSITCDRRVVWFCWFRMSDMDVCHRQSASQSLFSFTSLSHPRTVPPRFPPEMALAGPASGGRKGTPLPVQANNLANYFAALPSGAASKPFVAPRPSASSCSPSPGWFCTTRTSLA